MVSGTARAPLGDVNAAPAYLVNDIYKKYINPHASERKYGEEAPVMMMMEQPGRPISFYYYHLQKL